MRSSGKFPAPKSKKGTGNTTSKVVNGVLVRPLGVGAKVGVGTGQRSITSGVNRATGRGVSPGRTTINMIRSQKKRVAVPKKSRPR